MSDQRITLRKVVTYVLAILIPALVLIGFALLPREDEGKKRARAFLTGSLLDDTDRQVRGAAARALGKIGNP